MRKIYEWLGYIFCEIAFNWQLPDRWFDENGESNNWFIEKLADIHFAVYRLGCRFYEKAYF